MHIELYADKQRMISTSYKVDDAQIVDLRTNRPAPRIYIDAEDVEANTGHATSAEMVEIEIICEVGDTLQHKSGKFWIGARLNKQGRPVVDVATNVGAKTITKKVTGSWR